MQFVLSSSIEQAVQMNTTLTPWFRKWSIAAAMSQARLCAKSLAMNTAITHMVQRVVNGSSNEHSLTHMVQRVVNGSSNVSS